MKNTNTNKNSKIEMENNIENPTDKIFYALRKNNNSFFEDDPNYLYEYLSRIHNKPNDHIKVENDLKKKVFKIGNTNYNDFENIGFKYEDKDFKIPNSEDSIEDYKENLANYIILKNKLKNDQFLIRKESNRNLKDKDIGKNPMKQEGEDNQNLIIRKKNKDKALYGFQEENNHNEKRNIEKFIELNQKNLNNERKTQKENLEGAGNLKMIQTYSAKEIEDYYNYKKKLQINYKNIIEKIDDDNLNKNMPNIRLKMIEKVKNKANILNNNVILFKPSIFKSKKQQHYEMAFSEQVGNNNQINILMKNKTNFKDLEENEVKFKLENFERKVNEIENKNYLLKLERLEALNTQINNQLNRNQKNQHTIKNNENTNILIDDSFHEQIQTKKKDKDISIIEKILNFFIGDPNSSYASKKHNWCGNDRPYGKYFQDTRVFGEEYENQIAGEDEKLVKLKQAK